MEEKILEFIQRKLFHKKRKLGRTDSLFGAGVIDSVGHLQLITFLEKEYHVSFSLNELTWENFNTVDQIAVLVRAKLEKSRAQGK